MPQKPMDTESDELEVKFDSCMPFTLVMHTSLLAQLKDLINSPTPPKPPSQAAARFSLNANQFVDLNFTPGSGNKINWAGYQSDQDTDHGFAAVEVISATAKKPTKNAISQLQDEINSLIEAKLHPVLKSRAARKSGAARKRRVK